MINEGPRLRTAVARTVDQPQPVIDASIQKIGRRRQSPYVKYFCKCVSLVLAFFVAFGLFYVATRILIPPCPAYERSGTCNGHGSCNQGLCECDIAFSGKACTDTMIPGYDLVTDSSCNGQGFVFPYFLPAAICANNWANPDCVQYVNDIWTLIANAGGDASQVPYSITIPLCTCYGSYAISYGPSSCTATFCPADENAAICSNNGNTSVGLIANYTNAGNGCQCINLFSFYEYPGLFDQNTTIEFMTNYNIAYNQVFCGKIYQVFNETNGTYIPNVVLAYDLPSDFECFCAQGWEGPICGQGQCPMVNQVVCSGHGSQIYGQGIAANVSYDTSSNGLRCNLVCDPGYLSCGGSGGSEKCYSSTSSELDQVDQSQFCASKLRCPKTRPIRCADGSCGTLFLVAFWQPFCVSVVLAFDFLYAVLC